MAALPPGLARGQQALEHEATVRPRQDDKNERESPSCPGVTTTRVPRRTSHTQSLPITHAALRTREETPSAPYHACRAAATAPPLDAPDSRHRQRARSRYGPHNPGRPPLPPPERLEYQGSSVWGETRGMDEKESLTSDGAASFARRLSPGLPLPTHRPTTALSRHRRGHRGNAGFATLGPLASARVR